ncbi:MAG TPA: hypothetical protein VEW91_01915 [bacterium]|nr:hypothetical protein [bacterium]
MWGNERTYRMIAEERIRQYRREADQDRRAEQAAILRGPTRTPIVSLLDGISRMFVHRYLLPLLASVWRH